VQSIQCKVNLVTASQLSRGQPGDLLQFRLQREIFASPTGEFKSNKPFVLLQFYLLPDAGRGSAGWLAYHPEIRDLTDENSIYLKEDANICALTCLLQTNSFFDSGLQFRNFFQYK
jgi:hypothetical protein